MSELLNCPFCGSVAEFEYDDWNPETGEGDDGMGYAKCTNPHCCAGFHDDRDSAVYKWNKRYCVIGWKNNMNTETETETLINILRDRMEEMSDEARLDLMAALMEGFCRHCGSDNLPCYCTRDE